MASIVSFALEISSGIKNKSKSMTSVLWESRWVLTTKWLDIPKIIAELIKCRKILCMLMNVFGTLDNLIEGVCK